MGSHTSAAASVMVSLRQIVRFLRLADREAQTTAGLSAAQLFVLHTLHDAPALSLAELAEHTLTDQSSVSTVVAKLVAQRLVKREISPADRRRVALRLTSTGERVVRKSPRVPQQRHIADVVQGMPKRDRAELVRSLELLVTALGVGELSPRMLFEDESPRSRNRVR